MRLFLGTLYLLGEHLNLARQAEFARSRFMCNKPSCVVSLGTPGRSLQMYGAPDMGEG